MWNSSVPVPFDLQASWASPSFAVAVCLRATTGTNVASLFVVTAELFFVNATAVAEPSDARIVAIVGGVLGGLAMAAMLAVLVVWAVRKKRQTAQMSEPLLRGSQESGGGAMADMTSWGAREESVLGPPDAGFAETGQTEQADLSMLINELNKPII